MVRLDYEYDMSPEQTASLKMRRPWWREPYAILFGSLVFLTCGGLIAQGWMLPQPGVDPTKPAVLPGGGSFCDTPVPTKSTLERPKPLKANSR